MALGPDRPDDFRIAFRRAAMIAERSNSAFQQGKQKIFAGRQKQHFHMVKEQVICGTCRMVWLVSKASSRRVA